jgi:large subunit ribosomal protein L32
MAHPKRKSRKQEEMRRTHYKATVAICYLPIGWHIYTTDLHEGKMYYRGQVVIDKSVAVA